MDGWQILYHDQVDIMPAAQLTAAGVATQQATQWSDDSIRGLTLGIVKGNLDYNMAHQPGGILRGALAFALSSTAPVQTLHHTSGPESFETLTIRLSPEALEGLVSTCPELRGLRACIGHNDFKSWRPKTALMELVDQSASCSLEGALRAMYLQAKGLEMLSLILADLTSSASTQTMPHSQSVDVDRLYHARYVLEEQMIDPPSLHDLAKTVGMSVSRLTVGFRNLFGTSIVGFVQQRRMEVAKQLLADSATNVAQIAYSVGYTPAHFATLFRRHYGCSPTDIRRHWR